MYGDLAGAESVPQAGLSWLLVAAAVLILAGLLVYRAATRWQRRRRSR